MPEPGMAYRVVHRLGNVGSLGRQRFLALADRQGQRIAIEAEQLAPTAHYWARPDMKLEIRLSCLYREILGTAVRVRDPWVQNEHRLVRPQWLVRRLSPDCGRIELARLPEGRDERKLLEAMGQDAANVHLGSRGAIAAVKSDLQNRNSDWLRYAASALAKSVEEDWKQWKEGQ